MSGSKVPVIVIDTNVIFMALYTHLEKQEGSLIWRIKKRLNSFLLIV